VTDRPDFSINLGRLKKREKDSSPANIAKADQTAEDHGFLPREPRGRGGRRPSPRTGQVHAKVLPHIADEIAAEATRRGVTQGLLIEEAWALYLTKQGG
jgi:hypothetical protein